MKKNPVIEKIQLALGRGEQSKIPERPAILPSRVAGNVDEEIELFFGELDKLSASGKLLSSTDIPVAMAELVMEYSIKKATIWQTPNLKNLRLAERLNGLDVSTIENEEGKLALAECDLGITEVACILPDTGTIVLRASETMPRAASLLPRVHLAIATPECLREDLAEVLEECKESNYFVFISGPSRTADIEMTPALGVHGPRELVVWMMRDQAQD